VRVRRELRTPSGKLDVIGASGAALDHPDRSVRAGFNLYEFNDNSLASVEAYVVDPQTGGLQATAIGDVTGCG
jgi:hypothetical protein